MNAIGLPVATVARALAAARVAAGAALLTRPDALARALRVDSATARRTTWLARMAGARDLAVGAGTLFALTRGGGARSWLLASAASDAADAAVLTGALREKQVAAVPALLVGGLAAGAAAVQLAGTTGRCRPDPAARE